MGQQNDDRRHSEAETLLRGPWPQTGQEPRRSSQEAGTGKREGSHLSERRGGACRPQWLQQSPARGRRATIAPGRLHGPKPLQLAAALTLALLVFLAAGRGGAPKHTPPSPPPPTIPPPP